MIGEMRRVLNGGEDVFTFEELVISQDLLDGRSFIR
jgi:hypothetical protein